MCQSQNSAKYGLANSEGGRGGLLLNFKYLNQFLFYEVMIYFSRIYIIFFKENKKHYSQILVGTVTQNSVEMFCRHPSHKSYNQSSITSGSQRHQPLKSHRELLVLLAVP